VPVDVASIERDGLKAVGAAFDEIHGRLFTFALDVEHEMVNLRAIVQGRAANVKIGAIEKGNSDVSAALAGESRVWVNGGWGNAKIYDRSLLRAGNVMAGPAIVIEMDSTTLVLPEYSGEVDAFGNILIRPITR
jgi:N-methylhydantoinase A